MTELTSRSAVDRLARLRARMKLLEAKEAELVDILRRSNHDTVAGRHYVATITRSHREMVDPDRVRDLLADRTPTRTVTTFSVRTAPRAPAPPSAAEVSGRRRTRGPAATAAAPAP